MRQGRGGARGYGSKKRWLADSHVCVCTKCGYSVVRVPGIPCRSVECPFCQVPLVRGGDLQEKKNNHSDISEDDNRLKSQKTKIMGFPKVNLDRCIGCGSCVDVCPADAISLVDGKAVIDLDKCANCHACESVCPVDAIY